MKWWYIPVTIILVAAGLLLLGVLAWDIYLQVEKADDSVVSDVSTIKERITNINVDGNDDTTFEQSIVVEDIVYTSQLIIGSSPGKRRVVPIPVGKSVTYKDFYVAAGSSLNLWDPTNLAYFSAADAVVANTAGVAGLATAVADLLAQAILLQDRLDVAEANIEVLNVAVSSLSAQIAARIQYMGNWSVLTTYPVNSMVFYNASYWIALTANTASPPSYINPLWTGWAM